MSQFHNTVSRRDFMKALGVTGVGLGVASAVGPSFHDLDELAASQKAGHKLPWYVKQKDTPTAEIDWSAMSRYDLRKQYNPGADTEGAEGYPNVAAKWAAEQRASMIDYAKSGKKGAELKDLGIALGSQWGWIHEAHRYYSFFTDSNFPVVLPGGFQTPQEVGIPKHQGSAEENARMIRAAFHYFGAAHVSFQELDDNTLKLIYANDSGGRPYVFEDVEQPYATPEKYVIPKKCKYVISYLVVQNLYSNKVGQSWDSYIGGAAVAKAYSELNFLQGRVMTFVRTLGYTGVGSNPGHVNGFAVLGGQGELGRANIMIHPVYGMVGRVPNMLLTDLPVPNEKPIDFGAFKFCETCMKCADTCPSGSISTEKEPSWDTAGPWNAGGVRTWYANWKTCLPYRNMRYPGLCGNCQGICVFSKLDAASVHEVVKGVVGTTTIFNGFFRNMDDAFGYNNYDTDDWWNREIPFKYDATSGRWW
ncbi:MAG: reductive dehalogenase [Dehalogenimonas sp.]|nr:reductive dehalogenase [Dehalogenimonas sp.]